MPNIKSAKKRVKVNATKSQLNKSIRSNLRTTLKKTELLLAQGGDGTAEAVRQAIKTVDQAAAKGIIHKNAASRRKSALVCKLNKIG